MSDPGENVAGSLTRKVGPLPGYMWVVLVAGAAWALWWYRGKRVSAQPVAQAVLPSPEASSIPASPFPAQSAWNGLQTGENGAPAADSLSVWMRNAANALVAQGSDPLAVQNALSHYVSGVKMDSQESAIISQIITKFGSPPGGPIATQNVDANHLYTVQPGDTLSDIAKRYYGTADANTLRILQGANSNITWDAGTSSYKPLQMGQQIQLVPNGIAGVQNDTLKVG